MHDTQLPGCALAALASTGEERRGLASGTSGLRPDAGALPEPKRLLLRGFLYRACSDPLLTPRSTTHNRAVEGSNPSGLSLDLQACFATVSASSGSLICVDVYLAWTAATSRLALRPLCSRVIRRGRARSAPRRRPSARLAARVSHGRRACRHPAASGPYARPAASDTVVAPCQRQLSRRPRGVSGRLARSAWAAAWATDQGGKAFGAALSAWSASSRAATDWSTTSWLAGIWAA